MTQQSWASAPTEASPQIHPLPTFRACADGCAECSAVEAGATELVKAIGSDWDTLTDELRGHYRGIAYLVLSAAVPVLAGEEHS